MRSERIAENDPKNGAEEAVNDVMTVAKEDAEEKRKIVVYTVAATTLLISVIEILLSFRWDSGALQMTVSIPYSAIIPGILMIICGLLFKIRGKQTHGVWAIGICLLLVPVILFGAAFLICAMFNS